MKTKDIFQCLKNDIHSTVFATVDENGLPQTCVIDIMLCDDDSLYFITAKGKNFYSRLVATKYVAISGMKGQDTLSTIAISLRGKVRDIGRDMLCRVFEENSYMADIYRQEESRTVLTVFQLYEGEGEYFDLSQIPPRREPFSFGNAQITKSGYQITKKCSGCGVCLKKCPVGCIKLCNNKLEIMEENCIRCGNCLEICKFGAVAKI